MTREEQVKSIERSIERLETASKAIGNLATIPTYVQALVDVEKQLVNAHNFLLELRSR